MRREKDAAAEAAEPDKSAAAKEQEPSESASAIDGSPDETAAEEAPAEATDAESRD